MSDLVERLLRDPAASAERSLLRDRLASAERVYWPCLLKSGVYILHTSDVTDVNFVNVRPVTDDDPLL